MQSKLIKYWKVELYEAPKANTGSVVTVMLSGEERSPFLTGYSNTQFDLRKAVMNGEEFITLCCEPDSLQTRSIRISRIYEFRCTPIYESGEKCCDDDEHAKAADDKPRYNLTSFEDAAKPLIKWLAENVHPHHQAIVTSTHAELLESQYVVKTDEFLNRVVTGLVDGSPVYSRIEVKGDNVRLVRE